jgi:hypothetical protein
MSSHFPDGHFPEGHFPDGHFPELDGSEPLPPTARSYFAARREQKVFPVRLIMADECSHTFDSVVKDPAAARKVVLDLFAICAVHWRPNEQFDAQEFIRPTRANGFSYECTTAGLTAFREPVWPTTVGQTVASGSAVFTCRAAGSNGLNAISNLSASSDLTVSDVSVSETCKIAATYAIGGTVEQDYPVVFTFDLDGVPRVARQLVKVREQ